MVKKFWLTLLISGDGSESQIMRPRFQKIIGRLAVSMQENLDLHFLHKSRQAPSSSNRFSRYNSQDLRDLFL
ncbi:hypothetical protein A4S05_37415 [Nostoc sp. KVJ20]|nr:hypothetical protein A4S05_37415 [Nostoc sp. KVJ20]